MKENTLKSNWKKLEFYLLLMKNFKNLEKSKYY